MTIEKRIKIYYQVKNLVKIQACFNSSSMSLEDVLGVVYVSEGVTVVGWSHHVNDTNYLRHLCSNVPR